MKTFKEYFLREAPLPPDWDQTVYTPQTSFAKQVKYAIERSKKIGTGSSRIAFEIQYEGRPTILKIAKNKKGLAQNEKEGDYGLYRMYPDITVPLIDYDEINSPPIWIHVEKANKMTASQFATITGISFKDFSNMLRKNESDRLGSRSFYIDYSAGISDELKQKIENNELFLSVTDLMGNFDILAGDLSRLANWGLYQNRPVIIDLGFSSEINKLYYSR